MNMSGLSRAVRGLYYRQRLSSETHRLENKIKSFLVVHKLKKITIASLKVELKRGRLIITKVPFEDQRQLKLKYVV